MLGLAVSQRELELQPFNKTARLFIGTKKCRRLDRDMYVGMAYAGENF
jgi:hypothetical protein